jgi:hypothetical protein
MPIAGRVSAQLFSWGADSAAVDIAHACDILEAEISRTISDSERVSDVSVLFALTHFLISGCQP